MTPQVDVALAAPVFDPERQITTKEAKMQSHTKQTRQLSNRIPDKQWGDWAERIMRGEHLEEEMQNAGVLPHADTPLPPTNAIIHLLGREIGYGTPDRTFVAECGVTWKASEESGEHKYFLNGDYLWHKHINCVACRRLMENGHGED